MCEEEGIAVIPYNPLAGGLLTGKHDRKAPPPDGTRFALGTAARRYQERYWNERNSRQSKPAPGCRRGRHEHGDPGVVLGAVEPAITAPIVGASRPEQLADSLAAAERGPLPVESQGQAG